MTLLEVRQKFIESSGRADLVVDLTDYADNGADWYINRAQRYLDRTQGTPGTKKWYHADIAAGEAQLLVPDLRVVLGGKNGGVWVTEADGTNSDDKSKYKVEKKDIEWMRENYATSDAGIDTGRPLYYCNRSVQTAAREIIYDGKFSDDTAGVWTLASGWTISGGALVGNSVTGDAELAANDLRLPTALIAGRKYLTTFTISEIAGTTSGGIKISIDGGLNFGTSRTTTGTYVEVLQADASAILPGFTIRPTAAFTGKVKDVSVKEIATYETERLIGSHYENWRGITLMPPSDSTYTVTLFGMFYSPKLLYDYDTSYWTEEHPEILVIFANAELEAFYRNSEGMRDWHAIGHEKLFSVEKDVVEEEIAEITYMGE